MNPSQIRFAQSVSGRQQQILTHGTVVPQQGASSTPGNMVVLRQPMMASTISNAPGNQVSGATTVRSLVVSQGSARPIAANAASLGTNVQMYLAPQPVSILPRGGAPTNSSFGQTMGRGWPPPPPQHSMAVGAQSQRRYPMSMGGGGGAGHLPTSNSHHMPQHSLQHHPIHSHTSHAHFTQPPQHSQTNQSLYPMLENSHMTPTSHGILQTVASPAQSTSGAVSVQAAHSASTVPAGANDGGTTVVSAGGPRIISSCTAAVRPAISSAPPVPISAAGAMRGALSVSDDPSQIESQVKKCHSFLSCLIRFSGDSQEKKRQLIAIMQELIDAKITVVDFMQRVTDCLKSNYQLPQLRPFLEMVLPHLRREMFHGRIAFEDGGLRRPPAEALQARPSVQHQQPMQPVTAAIASPVVRPLHTQQQQPQPQLIQSSQTATPIRPGTAVQIHASPVAQHYVGGQRPITPGVAGTPRAITTLSAPGLRPLHPRPSPAVMAMNTNQHHHPHPLQPHGANMTQAQGQVAIGQAGVAGGLKRMAPRTQAAATEDYEEYNDVAMMGGVNLNEESRNILPNVIGPTATGGRTCKEQLFVPASALRMRALKHTPGVNSLSDEATALLANALEERLKNLFARLSIAIEHRTTQYRDCSLFEQETDVKGQLKFLEEIDRAEKVRHDDEERAALIKAARSRSRNENTDHLKMKEKARLLMQKEYELEKQREANITALAAIGSRKKRKLDTDFAQLSNDNSRNPGSGGLGPGGAGGAGPNKFEGMASKRVVRRATMKDLVYVMEHDPILQRSQLIWKAIFK